MILNRLSALLALMPLLAVGNPGAGVAQNSDPYSSWTYLYNNTFQDSTGAEISQEWRLNPRIQRNNSLLKFTLLARRTPVGSNGAAAAEFDYVTDCNTLEYALEEATQLDSSNNPLGTQTYNAVMGPADANSDPDFYSVLDRLCKGELPG